MKDDDEKRKKAIAIAKLLLRILESEKGGVKTPGGGLGPAGMLEIAFKTNGRAAISINHDRAFHLSSKLACFFDIIASPSQVYSDGTVCWKHPTTILREMAARGHRITKRALHQLKYRLRKELNQRGYNPDLVEYDPVRRSMRFAWRPPKDIASRARQM
jgi:hypothetical protein